MAVAPQLIGHLGQKKRESLPIFKAKNDLVQAMIDNKVLIVVGATGTGKSTQITQYLVEFGLEGQKRVVCAQPYSLSAAAVADHVAKEYGCNLGEDVGFTDANQKHYTSQDTVINYTTYANLLNEGGHDPDFRSYSVVILDDAHERTIATDALFGLMKSAINRRNDLKLIITCAEWNAESISHFFTDSHIFAIPSKSFPVEILYESDPHFDDFELSLRTCLKIHLYQPAGDILFYPPDYTKTDCIKKVLYESCFRLGINPLTLIIFNVDSELSPKMQAKIFEPAPAGQRKLIIVNSDVAEASLTIDGISYVVDSGRVSQLVYNPDTSGNERIMCPISQAVAIQRTSRAGQAGPGKCYRIFSNDVYENMSPRPVPEIFRVDLAATIFLLQDVGIDDLMLFNFIDHPSYESLCDAYARLIFRSTMDKKYILQRVQILNALIALEIGADPDDDEGEGQLMECKVEN